MKNNEKRKEVKNGFIGVTASLFLVIAAATIALNASQTFASTVAELPGMSKVVRILTFGKFEYKENGFMATIEMPQIEGLENKELERQINDNFLDYSEELIKTFLADMKNLKENFPGEEVHMGIQSGYTIKTDNEEVLAFDLYMVNMVGSSSTIHKYYTIDKKTQTLLSLPGLFKEDSNYREVISHYIKEEMKRQNEAGTSYYWTKEDTSAEVFDLIKEDQSFYINNEGNLVICFDKYEVGPGSSGSPEFIIPNDVIKDIKVNN